MQNTLKIDENNTNKTPAANEQFATSGGATPQTILYKIERYYPARTLVKPRLREAAGTLAATADR